MLAGSADSVDGYRRIGEVLREGEKRVGGGVLGPFNRRSCMEEGLGFAQGHQSTAGRGAVFGPDCWREEEDDAWGRSVSG
jgi:hypothetical protein